MGCTRAAVGVALSLILLAAPMTGCGGGTKKRVREVTPTLSGAPSVLRGTIGYETSLRRAEAEYVSGYGLVVGLNGSGSTNVPENVAATMEREILIWTEGDTTNSFAHTPLAGLSPREIIRHPDTAVVLVEGAIPPGAPDGTLFDIRVRALSGSTAESLEGGTLWTTNLQIGPASTLGGLQTGTIAEARGEVFINPFAEPGQASELNTRIGRVLGGGRVTEPQPLELLLQTPLHSRSQAITRAINERFPDGPRGANSTAKGRDDQVIQVYAPPAYKDRFEEFVQLLLHTPINQEYPEVLAKRYTRSMIEDPSAADELSWALRAIGPRSIGFVRDIYEFPERGPRMAALRAGAHLGDTRATAFLERLAFDADSVDRLEAIQLLGIAPGRGSIERALHELIADEDQLPVRVAAYEALMERAKRYRLEELVATNSARPTGQRASIEQIIYLAESRIPRGNPQGVERQNIQGRFELDIVPFGEPMVYVTQQGRPRIALIGRGTKLETPMFVSAWSDRLIMVADSDEAQIRLRYAPSASGPILTQSMGTNLDELIKYMARDASATETRPGLGFTYSQVVGALAAIQASGGTNASFATESDRLMAQLLNATQSITTDRPALIGGEGEEIDLDPVAEEQAKPVDDNASPYVVPLKPPTGAAGGDKGTNGGE